MKIGAISDAESASALLDLVEECRLENQKDIERFEVALAGTLRLLSGKGESVLRGLAANPEDIEAYLLRELLGLKERSIRRYVVIIQKTNETLQSIRKQ